MHSACQQLLNYLQDCLENLFSILRSLGGTYINPMPAEMYNRLRIVLLGAWSKVPVETAPVQMVPEEDARMVEVQAQEPEPPQAEAETADETDEVLRDDGAEMVTAGWAMASLDEEQEAAAAVSDELNTGAADPDRFAGAVNSFFLEEVRDEIDNEELFGQPMNLSDFNEDVEDEFEGEPVLADLDDEWLGAVEVDADLLRQQLLEESAAECEEQAFQYICGWLAHEFSQTHPELGTPTGRLLNRDQLQPWLERLSRGGLRNPDPGFVGQVRLWESAFNRYHGGNFSISYEKGVIKNFTKLLSEQFPEWDVAVLKKYAVFRTFCRMKYLERLRRAQNRERIESNRALRKKRQYRLDT